MSTNEDIYEMSIYEEMHSTPEALAYHEAQALAQAQESYQNWLDEMDDEERAPHTPDELTFEAWLDRQTPDYI